MTEELYSDSRLELLSQSGAGAPEPEGVGPRSAAPRRRAGGRALTAPRVSKKDFEDEFGFNETPARRRNKAPKPPKYVPQKAPLAPLSRRQIVIRSVLLLVVATQVGFLFHLVGYSQLRHAVRQAQLRSELTSELAAGIAPVSEGTFENVLLLDGAPVARISIPSLGVDEIVVEGTSADTLMSGPGHRRDTVLPGQAGTSVLLGRAWAYGGPFNKIQELAPGESISVVTGQGESLFKVLGVRYAGDPAPAAVVVGKGRLTLQTARGFPFLPTATVFVDAELVSDVQAVGRRATSFAQLPASNKAMASDTSTLWALVFALQFLIVAEVGSVYAWVRFGRAKTWLVATPVLILAFLLVFDQVTKLLPNLT
jgi:LPXTG-site transpeptidase (sortase) family protein